MGFLHFHLRHQMAAVTLAARWAEHMQVLPQAPLPKSSTGDNWLSRAQTGILSNCQSGQKNQSFTQLFNFIKRVLSQCSFSAPDCVLRLTSASSGKYASVFFQGTIISLPCPCSSAVLGSLKMRFSFPPTH